MLCVHKRSSKIQREREQERESERVSELFSIPILCKVAVASKSIPGKLDGGEGEGYLLN